MTKQDAAYLDLVDLCYASLEDGSAWDPFVRRLTRALDADAGDFTIEHYASGRADALGSLGFDPGFRIDYDESFLLENPWIEELKALPLRRSFSSQFEPDDFELSPYYNEWVRPQGFRHAMGALIEHDARQAIHIGVLRNRDRAPFGAEDTRFLDRLLPHIHRALRLRDRLCGAGHDQGPLEALIDQLHVPAFLVGSDCRLVGCNRPGRDMLDGRTALGCTRQRLSVQDPAAASGLDAAVARACRIEALAEAPERTEITIPRTNGDGPPLVADVIPIRPGDALLSSGPACLVLVTDPAGGLADDSDLLERLWALTPAETALARALADGMALSDHAARAGISIGTARWHLKNVEAKLGVNSTAALAARVQGALRRA